MAHISRDEAIILGLLSQLPRETLRTKLVKPIYLLDNTYFENMDRQATHFVYHWDHNGPNTIGNAVTDTLTRLTKSEYIRHVERLIPYGNFANY